MTFTPLKHQLDAQNMMKNIESRGKGGFLCDEMGLGKCLHPDTKVLLWDGGYKLAKNIVVGDMLIGDDSSPRTVYSTVKGQEMMYKIKQHKAEDYTVNESHILSLKISGHKGWCWYEKKKQYCVCWFDRTNMKFRSKYFGPNYGNEEERLSAMYRFRDTIADDNTLDITVKQYLKLNKTTQSVLKGYKVGVDFPYQDVSIDPYLLGAWLGDGHSTGFGFTNIDEEILSYVSEKLADLNCSMIPENEGSITKKWRSNGFIKILDVYNLRKNKHIPNCYLHNSRDIRLHLLAGLIDTDGYLIDDCCCYEIIQKRKELAEDIAYLCRSLGFFVSLTETEKSCLYKGEMRTGTYYKCVISGEYVYTIPCLLQRKIAIPRTQKKDVMVTNIEVEKLEVGEYCGFTIDGNRRFLLGDFTVTHNTVTISMFLHTNKYPNLPDLIVCPFSLLSTWEEWLVKSKDWDIERFRPKICLFHGSKREKNIKKLVKYDFVITTYAIISTGELEKVKWGRVILDESHYIKNGLQRNAPKCAKAAFNIGLNSKKNWAVSGTPFNNRMKDIASQALFIGTAPYNDPKWWKKNENVQSSIEEWRSKFTIRRTKEDMITPPEYNDISVEPTKVEGKLVAALRAQAHEEFMAWKKARNMKDNEERIRLQGVILGLIQKLRIFSNSYYCGQEDYNVDEVLENNAKVEKMINDLDRAVDADPKKGVVFFSQFTSFLTIFEDIITEIMPGVEVLKFFGNMSKNARDEVVKKFNTSREPRVILVSLMAGGVGLSLHHGSNTVMLAEPYYNPFVEKQAEERVHRLGQEEIVKVYRYSMNNSVESWIEGLKKKKLTLAGGLDLVNQDSIPVNFNFDDIGDLFREHVGFSSTSLVEMEKHEKGDKKLSPEFNQFLEKKPRKKSKVPQAKK